jgi:hypothetical protein
MWPFKDKNIPETTNKPKFLSQPETTFLASTIVNGEAYIAEAGIEETETGWFRVWTRIDPSRDSAYGRYYPKQVVMSRERAIHAARVFGQAHEVCALLSRDQALEWQA